MNEARKPYLPSFQKDPWHDTLNTNLSDKGVPNHIPFRDSHLITEWSLNFLLRLCVLVLSTNYSTWQKVHQMCGKSHL
jgi:hypothetical protein